MGDQDEDGDDAGQAHDHRGHRPEEKPGDPEGGRSVRIPRDALRRWIDDHSVGVAPANAEGHGP
jgi:hypothetical protein